MSPKLLLDSERMGKELRGSKIFMEESQSVEAQEKVIVDNKKIKVEIYKDISPLLGPQAIKRLISRSDAQLNPMLNKAS